jgi:hypothetical protein
MSGVNQPASIRLTEPCPIDDDLCTGLALVEDVGGFAGRLVFFSEQTIYEAGEPVNVVKSKVVLPLAAIAPTIERLRNFADRGNAPATPQPAEIAPPIAPGTPTLVFSREP